MIALDRLTQPTTALVMERVWRARHELYRVRGEAEAFTVHVDPVTWAAVMLEHGADRLSDGHRLMGMPFRVDPTMRRDPSDRPAIVLRAEVVA